MPPERCCSKTKIGFLISVHKFVPVGVEGLGLGLGYIIPKQHRSTTDGIRWHHRKISNDFVEQLTQL